MKKITSFLLICLTITSLSAFQKQDKPLSKHAMNRLNTWDSLVQRLSTEEAYSKVRNVNAFFNRYRYKSDAYNWQTVEYWATFQEFMSKGSGDCEDFALAKYYTLRKLGIPATKLKLVTGKYLGQGHMVLLYYKEDNSPYILDKNNRYLIKLSESKRFKPETYFNEISYGLFDKSIAPKRVQKEYELFLYWWSLNQ